ncbi:helix-turn-helix protein [Streptomyces sp. Ag109_O5-1]|uniref:helix-turn-helix transcriptional regulator n=1 Tax=Streptomyces sp. Ag109_O5-1 TaxID=1938851 RepID=UPI000F51002B|nr:helix-turn-helix transcriptional regulator [Streptomyces sp. Ag109_O5-1]RPE47110.1 helix-turn-helix protein [Streptomyces sp. Ag109_O5-1]
MDRRQEISDFLSSRRAKITPEQAGLPAYGGDARRVPGLRREEVASLAGVSVDYYTRLERGNARGVSDGVLDNLARALQLNEAERTHLFDLVRSVDGTVPRSEAEAPHIPPAVLRILHSMVGLPAYVRTPRFDTLAANQLGLALFSPFLLGRTLPVNNARFVLLDPRAVDFFPDWETIAHDTIAALRWQVGRNPQDKALADLVDELSARSELFRTCWADHNVRIHRGGVKTIRHPLVGDLTLSYESMTIDSDAGLILTVYSAEPDSPSEKALRRLAEWATTVDHEQSRQASTG